MAQTLYDRQCAVLTYETVLQPTYAAFLDTVRRLYATARSSAIRSDGFALDFAAHHRGPPDRSTVADFNGSATLTVPSEDGTISSSTITITNGVGTATLTAPSSVPSSPGAITVSALPLLAVLLLIMAICNLGLDRMGSHREEFSPFCANPGWNNGVTRRSLMHIRAG